MTAKSFLKTLLLASCAATGLAKPTFAQDNEQDEDTGTSTRAVEEIIVTARRRDETLQEVPIAVSSLDGADLQRFQIDNLVDAGRFAPNVTLEVSRGTNTTITAFIRGVGQQDPVAGYEAGVGIYIDDVYLNRPQAAVLQIFDVERIEVLRGPQGTLYGRNTIGGAIKYVTKKIAEEPTASLRLGYGNFNERDLLLSASTPITDTLRISAAAGIFTRDGFGSNVDVVPSPIEGQPPITGPNFGQDNYSEDIIATRASIEWAPTESLFVRLQGDYLIDESDPRQGSRLIPSTSGVPVLDNVFDTLAGLTGIDQEVEAYGGAATIEYRVNDAILLKNIFAYRKDDSISPIDFDSLPVADIDVPVIYDNEQWSEEFQIVFDQDRFGGILGFYYLDANAFNEFEVLLGTTGDLIGLPGLNARTLGDVDTETWAIFGDFSYDITDTIQLSYGGRFTSDQRTARVLRETYIGGFTPVFGGNTSALIATTSDFNGSETFEEYTQRASISWTPVDNLTLYASYSEGFKGGGFDPRAQTTGAPDLDQDGQVSDEEIFGFLSFEPEEVTSYELGLKGSLIDGRINFAIAAFTSDYTNVQIPGSIGLDTDGDGINDTFTGVTTNAADATITGVEFEGNATVLSGALTDGDELLFDWTFGYLDAEFNEFIDAFGNDVADQRVFQNTPDFTGSARLTYSAPVTYAGVDAHVTLTNAVTYRSQASQFEVPNPLLDQDAFALWDASLIYQTDDGIWQFGIHAKNILDKEYIVAGYNFVTPDNVPTLGTEGTLTGFFGNPRTYQLTVQVSF